MRLNEMWKVSLLGAVLLCGCDTASEEKFEERAVNDLYAQGQKEMDEGRYGKAAVAFEEIERQHPYSELATKAQLLAAQAYYEDQNYEKALAGLEAFIQLHPAHADVPYAYYLQGLCYYEQVLPIERDQQIAALALDSFEEVVRRFPKSDQAREARLKIDLLRDTLAAKEMDVGRQYLTQGSYIAALNRFQKVVKEYQTTAHTPEALHRIVEISLAMGLKAQAQEAAAVLGHNYPSDSWYHATYALMPEGSKPEVK